MRGDLAFRIPVLLLERIGDGRRQAAVLIGLVRLRFWIGSGSGKQIFGNGRRSAGVGTGIPFCMFGSTDATSASPGARR